MGQDCPSWWEGGGGGGTVVGGSGGGGGGGEGEGGGGEGARTLAQIVTKDFSKVLASAKDHESDCEHGPCFRLWT